jgi:hypothetical protein
VLITILTSAIAGLIVAAILGMVRQLRVEDQRPGIRQFFCFHDWRPIDKGGLGTGFVFITADDEYCARCRAQRMLES